MSADRLMLKVYLTNTAALRFEFEPGVEEMLEAHQLQKLFGDTVAEFGENYVHKNRLKQVQSDVSKIVIPKGAIF